MFGSVHVFGPSAPSESTVSEQTKFLVLPATSHAATEASPPGHPVPLMTMSEPIFPEDGAVIFTL